MVSGRNCNLGGLMVFGLKGLGYGWRVQMAAMLDPHTAYGLIFLRTNLPQTERVSSGFSYKDMLKACVSPLFLFMAACMLLTAATELGSNQWMTALLENVMKQQGIKLHPSSGMDFRDHGPGTFCGRTYCAQAFPQRCVLASAIFSGIGLFLLSISSGLLELWGCCCICHRDHLLLAHYAWLCE